MDPTDYPTDYNESALPRVSAPYLGSPHNLNVHNHEFITEDYSNLAAHLNFFGKTSVA